MKAKKGTRRLRRQARLAIVYLSVGMFRLGERVQVPFYWVGRSLCRLLPFLHDREEMGEHDDA